MDRDTAVQRIQDGLGFRSDKSDTIVLRLQEEQRDLEKGKSLPRFLLQEDQTLSVTSGSQSLTIPTNFLRRYHSKLRYKATGETKYTYISWRDYDAAELAYYDSDPAGPKVVVLRKSEIKVYPEPDNDYTIYWDYYKSDTVLTSNVENTWLANAPELLIGGAGLRMAKDLRNKDATALFNDMLKAARISVFGDIILEDDDDEIRLGSNA